VQNPQGHYKIAVRDVINGKPVKNTEALANPEAVRAFAHFDSCAP
jgi:hypothetical protein